jgi:hypothetical protein
MSPADRSCILRYASGIALSAVLAFGIDWPLSFLATLLTAAFLGNRNPRPNLKATLGIIIAIAVIFAVGSAATLYLYPYPAVFLLLFCWCLYLTFYAAARGTSGFIILLYTLALLLLPLIGGPTPYMAVLVSVGLLKSAAAALVCVHIAHTLFPGGTFAVEQMPLQTTPREASHAAWLSTAVILPFALVCLVFNLSGAVLPLIIIATLAQKPDFSAGAAGAKALLAANIGGGLVAIMFFQLLTATPNLVFLVTGFFLLALLFGQQIFSDKPTAPLYGSAFSTVLVLIGTGTSAFGDQADAKFFERIALLLVGVSYLILALSVLQSINVRERWMGFGRWVGARLAAIARRLPV